MTSMLMQNLRDIWFFLSFMTSFIPFAINFTYISNGNNKHIQIQLGWILGAYFIMALCFVITYMAFKYGER